MKCTPEHIHTLLGQVRHQGYPSAIKELWECFAPEIINTAKMVNPNDLETISDEIKHQFILRIIGQKPNFESDPNDSTF